MFVQALYFRFRSFLILRDDSPIFSFIIFLHISVSHLHFTPWLISMQRSSHFYVAASYTNVANYSTIHAHARECRQWLNALWQQCGKWILSPSCPQSWFSIWLKEHASSTLRYLENLLSHFITRMMETGIPFVLNTNFGHFISFVVFVFLVYLSFFVFRVRSFHPFLTCIFYSHLVVSNDVFPQCTHVYTLWINEL